MVIKLNKRKQKIIMNNDITLSYEKIMVARKGQAEWVKILYTQEFI